MAKFNDYSGQKFNHLIMLRRARAGGAGVGAIWLVQCDCGKQREVVGKDVAYGRIRSCGECQYSRELASSGRRVGAGIRAGHRKLYVRYLNRAMTRNIPWNLSPEQFVDIIGKSCVYCGSDPDIRNKLIRANYSGLDRMDTTEGYTLDNCVPACSTCRAMKGDLNAKEFLDKLIIIATRLKPPAK